ncbi:MAG: M14 family metallopeptidase [Fimbriimonadaceae bacterium]|nr:M14 family metallopeptidase [Fimbriimonadaceae bacterium]
MPFLPAPDWNLTCEKTGFRDTGTYAEAVAFCRRLAEHSPSVAKVEIFGTTPQGRPMVALVLGKDDSRKPTVFIQSGIHAGEIEGKDATLMLARDIVVKGRHRDLLAKARLVIVPVFNVDGHERTSPYNRINQNGPSSMGWRTTAQNFNLNRDYIKLDAPETRALVAYMRKCRSEAFMDNHTSDGGDWQYQMHYDVPRWPNMPAGLVKLSEDLNATLADRLLADGLLNAPYFGGISPTNPERGVTVSPFTARFSHGYAAVTDRVSVLVETHMMKPYRDRVLSTYSIDLRTWEWVAAHAAELMKVRRASLAEDAQAKEGDRLVLTAKTGPGRRPWVFKGWKYTPRESKVTGAKVAAWEHVPQDVQSSVRDTFVPDLTVSLPAFYVVPAEWAREVGDILSLHGVQFWRTSVDHTFDAPVTVLDGIKFPPQPFENRFMPTFKPVAATRRVALRRGALVVPVGQPYVRVAAQLLEPQAPDSLVAWGFFNMVAEQKEGADGHMLEPVAQKMLDSDSKLKAEFEEKLKDPAFANNPFARLDFFYRHSPYWDSHLGVYPVLRLSAKDWVTLRSSR